MATQSAAGAEGDVPSPDGHLVAPEARSADRSSRAGRGRPRDDAADDRILEAAFVELAHSGISHFGISAVARRAGVAKNSVYLRWPDREQLVLDASARLSSAIVQPSPGSFRRQLRELADHYARLFQQPEALELSLRIDADRFRYPELFAKIFERMQGAANRVVEQTVIDAQRRGEIDAAVAPAFVVRLLTGAMFVEALAPPTGEVSEEFRASLVEFIVGRLESRQGARAS